MFLHKIGDKVRLTPESQNILTREVFTALKDEVFTITAITSDNSCEEKHVNCTCDKFVTLKAGNVIIKDVVSEEFEIVDIKESIDTLS